MYITSTGMVSPVGLSAEASCAAMRAAIANFVELPYVDNNGERIIGGAIPGLDLDLRRSERIFKLLAMAIEDCLSQSNELSFDTVPILVGMAEEGRPGGINLHVDSIIKEIELELGLRFHVQLSQTIDKGHTSGFEALRLARELLRDSRLPACLVCGVDSYINASSLLWLDHNWRLKSEENSDGVIPGEAAAAVLVQTQHISEAKRAVMMIGMGFGFEEAHILSDEPLLGLGLTEAVRNALAEAKFSFNEIDWRISDVTGEKYGFKELPLVEGRLMRVVTKKSLPLWHCADSIGDSGAAAGVAQLVMADEAFRREYAPGDKVICSSSSVSGDRAAAVLQRCSS